MSKISRNEYYLSIKGRYEGSEKHQKNQILDEFCKICGYNRKYAIRLLNNKEKIDQKKRKEPGRHKKYHKKR